MLGIIIEDGDYKYIRLYRKVTESIVVVQPAKIFYII